MKPHAGTRTHLLGRPEGRRPVAVTVGVLLVVASAAFLLGVDVGLSPGWLVVAVLVAVAGGVLGSGLVPTVGSLWALACWWFAFPPLVGYLTADWTAASRYTHPRTLGFAYGSAWAELVGGVEYGLRLGLGFALLAGTLGYLVGTGLRRLWNRTRN